MQEIDVLLTDPVGGGFAPHNQADLKIRLHRWTDLARPPRTEGELWVFIGWNLLDIAAVELCRRLRCDPATSAAHLTMVLKAGNENEGSIALRAGADDYVVGPLSRAGVIERITTIFVADRARVATRLIIGDLVVDVPALRARWRGKAIPLMPVEFWLLHYFVSNPGRVFTRLQLLEALGRQDPTITERTVDTWVSRLRKALQSVGALKTIRTVRSLGFIFDVD